VKIYTFSNILTIVLIIPVNLTQLIGILHIICRQRRFHRPAIPGGRSGSIDKFCTLGPTQKPISTLTKKLLSKLSSQTNVRAYTGKETHKSLSDSLPVLAPTLCFSHLSLFFFKLLISSLVADLFSFTLNVIFSPSFLVPSSLV